MFKSAISDIIVKLWHFQQKSIPWISIKGNEIVASHLAIHNETHNARTEDENFKSNMGYMQTKVIIEKRDA